MDNKTFVFDFDGVIVDSFETCWSVVKMSDPDITAQEYKEMFMGNIFQSLDKKYTKIDHVTFFKNYQDKILNVLPVQGIEELLKNCKEYGDVYIVSSTTSDVIKLYLEKYNLNNYITQILGSDVEKSKTKKLTNLIEQYSNNNLYFITDTLGDIIEAEKLYITTIGVLWGFHNKEMLTKGNPHHIADSVEQLSSLLLH